jgi:hypothetical protein
MRVLRTARALALPDWMLFSGAVYQPVLNELTGRDPAYGIADYDLAYFDPDTGYDAEDAVIRRVAATFAPPLRELVQVRNQARVHLWFEHRFGEPYPPLRTSSEALERFVSPMFAVAVRLEPDDRITVLAPFGLHDLFSLTLRANPLRRSTSFARVAASVRARWPEVEIAK